MLTSTWALAEVSSVLAIKVRQGLLTAADAQHAERQIAAMTADPLALEAVTPDDMVEARRLVRSSRNLRAPDALHLAIVTRLGVPMASFDDNLVDAASAAGCSVADL